MIDTIVLRIHNIDKYPQLYEQFYAPSKKLNTVTTSYVDEDTGQLIENSSVLSYIWHDTNRVLPLIHRSNIHIASSHYSLSYYIDNSRNFLEFNFSIPKYIYGLNVLQFVNELDTSANTTYLYLINFVTKFLKENLLQTPLFEDVEVNRIDLCYNQFFNSKLDSLTYLDKQKELLTKYARSSKNNYRSYDTSLLYITRFYSFKIYHKGTEFKKKDYKEIVKAGNKLNYPLQYFLDESDKILRYEMTFRKSFLNYIMKMYFFNSSSKREYYQYASHKLARFGDNLTLDKSVRASFHQKKRSVLEEFLSKEKKFCIKSMFDITNNAIILSDSDTITFDSTIFQILYNTFWEKVKQYQITNVVSIDDIMRKLNTYNDDVKTRNKIFKQNDFGKDRARLLIPALLAQYHNINDLKSYLPQRTYYRLLADLRKFGISTNQADIKFAPPKLDYIDYRIIFGKFHKSII